MGAVQVFLGNRFIIHIPAKLIGLQPNESAESWIRVHFDTRQIEFNGQSDELTLKLSED